MLLSSGVEPGNRTCAGRERIDVDSKLLQHVDLQIAEWRVIFAAKSQVLAMLEAAPSQQDRQVVCVVDVRIAEIATVKDHGVVQETLAILWLLGERVEQFAQGHHVLPIRRFELTKFLRVLAMVTEAMVRLCGGFLIS